MRPADIRRVRSLLMMAMVIGFFGAGVALGGVASLALWAMAAAAFMLALE